MKNNIQSAWCELNNQLRAFVASKVGDDETAKDLVQDVFIKVQSNVETLKNEQRLTSWVFQITRNAVNDYFRKLNQSQLALSPPQNAAETPSVSDETQELSHCMIPLIDQLPEKYREAIRLSDIEGLSQKELAERLQISYSGAKSRVQRGREKLREIFLQCCTISTDKYGNVIEFERKDFSCDC